MLLDGVGGVASYPSELRNVAEDGVDLLNVVLLVDNDEGSSFVGTSDDDVFVLL